MSREALRRNDELLRGKIAELEIPQVEVTKASHPTDDGYYLYGLYNFVGTPEHLPGRKPMGDNPTQKEMGELQKKFQDEFEERILTIASAIQAKRTHLENLARHYDTNRRIRDIH